MASGSRLVDRVRDAPALRRLKPGDVERLVAQSAVREFECGDPLLEEGDAAGDVYLLLVGRVGVFKRRGDVQERIAERVPLEWIGDNAALDAQPRSATAIAEAPVRALAVPLPVFREVVASDPEAALDLMRAIIDRLREADSALIEALRERVSSLSSRNQALEGHNRRLRAALGERPDLDSFAGSSRAVQTLRESARRAADSDAPILIEGETGTGKELLALAIHAEATRRGRGGGSFVPVNCGLLTESLVESELFGHAAGAFTGAAGARRGLVESADGGTLFLDEVGDMPGPLQPALLRFLETGEVRRLGETRLRRARVRVIAASHRPLDEAVEAGEFRRDLLYRLDVIRLSIPPLRERPEDIPVLVEHALRATAERLGSAPLAIGPEALDALCRCPFPGNVRELENEIERLYVYCEPGSQIALEDLSPRLLSVAVEPGAPYASRLRAYKIELIEQALRESGGNRTHAAERLGVERSNLVRMMRDLGLRKPDPARN